MTGPTLAANGTAAKAICKGNGLALQPGDIAGAGHWLELQYDLALDRWVLQNPATGVALLASGLQDLAYSTATANALTLILRPTVLYFRSTNLAAGNPSRRTFPSELNLVIPQGATLGTTSGIAARIMLLALDVGGTIELAVVNLAGGNSLDETGLISTTAISASATAANVIYSTTARTNVAYRVVGFADSTQTTAGTWAAAPTLVQGAGGLALASLGSLGYGQKWQDVTASRALGTTYYNTTGKPITVALTGYCASSGSGAGFVVNGVGVIGFSGGNAGSAQQTCAVIVPPAASYGTNGSGYAVQQWVELR